MYLHIYIYIYIQICSDFQDKWLHKRSRKAYRKATGRTKSNRKVTYRLQPKGVSRFDFGARRPNMYSLYSLLVIPFAPYPRLSLSWSRTLSRTAPWSAPARRAGDRQIYSSLYIYIYIYRERERDTYIYIYIYIYTYIYSYSSTIKFKSYKLLTVSIHKRICEFPFIHTTFIYDSIHSYISCLETLCNACRSRNWESLFVFFSQIG